MKRLITIGTLLLLLSGALRAQAPAGGGDSSFLLVRTYEGDIANAALDNLQNLYILSSTGQVRKYNAAGDSVGVYNAVRNYGKLTSIDVTNPLKVLLFYKDFTSVVVLDRFLAPLATLDLRRLNILQPSAVGLSYDNNIWVFDEYDNKLKKIDEQGNRLSETSDLRAAFGEGIHPQKILSGDRVVYLADTTGPVYVFDNYGSFQKRIVLPTWQSLALVRNVLVSTQSGMITVYNTSTLMQAQKKHPDFQPYLHSFTSADKFVSFSATRLQVYRYRF